MADKKISELQLISNLTDTVMVPGDNGIQTYRFTFAQLFAWIRTKLGYRQATITGAGTVLTSASMIVLLDPTSAGFTQALPACASFPQIALFFKNIATNGNLVTLDANSTELIERAETLDLGSDPVSEGVWLYNTGTKWIRLS